jgi:hypothetical protein
MRKLTREQYMFFGQSLEHNIHHAAERDADVFAQRLFVLRHLAVPDNISQLSSESLQQLRFQGAALLTPNEYAFTTLNRS